MYSFVLLYTPYVNLFLCILMEKTRLLYLHIDLLGSLWLLFDDFNYFLNQSTDLCFIDIFLVIEFLFCQVVCFFIERKLFLRFLWVTPFRQTSYLPQLFWHRYISSYSHLGIECRNGLSCVLPNFYIDLLDFDSLMIFFYIPFPRYCNIPVTK